MSDEKEKKLTADEKLATEMNNIRADVKTYGEKTEAEMKLWKERVGKDINEAQEKHDAEAATQKEEREAIDKKLEDGLDKLHTKVDRLNLFGEGGKEGRTDEQKSQMSAYIDYVKFGQPGLAKHDLKTYVTGVDAAAGHLVVPAFFDTSIVDQARLEVTPALSLASVQNLPADQYEVPTITAHAVAGRVAETGTTSEDTTFAVGKEIIRANYMTVKLKASMALLNDSAIGIEGLFQNEVANAMGKTLGTEFCTGATVYSMEGITINATIVAAAIASGSATAVTADGLTDLYFALKTAYMSNAKWLMRRSTMLECYNLKDGQGQYLLRWGLNQLEGKPVWSMLGSPVIEAADMPAIAGAALPIAWGDYSEGYKIVTVQGMTFLSDPYSSKETNIIEYMWWKRVGGKVKNPEAIYVQSIA